MRSKRMMKSSVFVALIFGLLVSSCSPNDDYELLSNILREQSSDTIANTYNPITCEAHFVAGKLEYLILSGSSKSNPPQLLRQLSNLEILELNGYTFSTIPYEHLPVSLKHLTVESCQMESFPSSFSELPNLQSFSLVNSGFHDTVNLSGLNASRLETISIRSSSVASVVLNGENVPTNLTSLILNYNEIKVVNPSLEKLPSLNHISLVKNPIDTLDLGNFPAIKKVTVDTDVVLLNVKKGTKIVRVDSLGYREETTF